MRGLTIGCKIKYKNKTVNTEIFGIHVDFKENKIREQDKKRLIWLFFQNKIYQDMENYHIEFMNKKSIVQKLRDILWDD